MRVFALPLVREPPVDRNCPSDSPSERDGHRLGIRIMRMTWVELWEFEPQTSCMPCTLRLSPHVAGRGPVWSSPAASVAACGLASPGVAPRWLPTWLPANSLAPLTSDDPYAFGHSSKPTFAG